MKYDTKSKTSFLVMFLTDLVFHRRTPSSPQDIRGRIRISSLGGLGDLFIQLPLIDALVKKYEADNDVVVVLQPQHREIAVLMNWNFILMDNPTVSFFKKGIFQAFKEFVSLIFSSEHEKDTDWWIDLTGNAVNALLLKSLMTKHLVQTIIRGGKGLTDIPLPNRLGDNEYDAQHKIADFFGVRCDLPSVRRKIFSASVLPRKKTVLTVLSTPCRWRCWKLENYEKLFSALPEYTFVCTGLSSQLRHESDERLKRLQNLPNVVSHVDKCSLTELIRLIWSASIVLTPDTSVAHIANLAGQPGILLFGPVDSDRWTLRSGKMRLLHHPNCKFYPCVQWRCKKPHNTCMDNISVEEVKKAVSAFFDGTSDTCPAAENRADDA